MGRGRGDADLVLSMWALIAITNVLIKERFHMYTKRGQYDQWGRDKSDAATSQEMPTATRGWSR